MKKPWYYIPAPFGTMMAILNAGIMTGFYVWHRDLVIGICAAVMWVAALTGLYLFIRKPK